MFSAALNKLIETFLMCMLAFLCLIECSDLNRWQYLTVEDITEQHYKKKKMQWFNFHRLVFIFSRTKHDVVVSRIPYSTVV